MPVLTSVRRETIVLKIGGHTPAHCAGNILQMGSSVEPRRVGMRISIPKGPSQQANARNGLAGRIGTPKFPTLSLRQPPTNRQGGIVREIQRAVHTAERSILDNHIDIATEKQRGVGSWGNRAGRETQRAVGRTGRVAVPDLQLDSIDLDLTPGANRDAACW